ncbi:LA_2272 family surface repeat-containing protein [Chitinophaga sp. 22536]|uniref:LA_2272 family surface repeat-containing protein n=1 Tax=unclassified Chitinophaga TaxID=2619133 RepID=UPI003F848F7E
MPFSRTLTILILIITLPFYTQAQGLLNKTVTVEARKQKLSEVLNIISRQGGFYFSYISNILPQDSLVSISVKNKTVRQTLDQLLDGEYLYKESGNYIILFKKSPGQNYYQITGFVTDSKTGQRVPNASVYERQQLISTLTNNDGYFRLRLRDKTPTAAISISKDLYTDTSVTVHGGQDQEVAVNISPVSYQLRVVEITGHNTKVEKTWWGRTILSSRQKMQSLNIGSFFADKPYQASLTPGLGSHGKMSSQVVNKFSINVIGGYTAGVDGFELGTVFNIVKGNMQHVQIGGVLNVVGGKTNGVQLAGVHNQVLDSMRGVQVGGVSNIVEGSTNGVQISGVVGQIHGDMEGVQAQGVVGIVKGNVAGWQVSGVSNHTYGNMSGAQISGVYNYADRDVSGAQISDLGNISHGTVRGVQLGVLFNYARHLKGVQIGLVNIADTSSGYTIGLVNIVKHGYHKLSIYTGDVINYNLAWKTGSSKLYSILVAGMNTGDRKVYSFGYGIGREFNFNKHLFLGVEITAQNMYTGSDEDFSQLIRIRPSLNYRISDKISIFAGPSLSLHVYDKWNPKPGYLSEVPGPAYHPFKLGDSGNGWIGWQAGITIF